MHNRLLGNWTTFKDRDTDTGSTWDLDQDRDHNDANEIDNDNNHANTPNGIATTTGMNWIDPKHDAVGNMTEIPQPTSLNDRRDLTYDAWNRLVKIKDEMTTVADYEYDGLNRRIVKIANSETRHFYYSTGSQVLEERVGTSTNADIQYIWGTRYIDDLILRDRDTNTNGTLDERLYALQDANWNIIALTDETGTVKQRFQYTPYGSLTKLDPDFTSYTGTDYKWEYTYTSRRLDDETGLMYYRARYYHPELGRFINRDPIGYLAGVNLYLYAGDRPVVVTDPTGLRPPGVSTTQCHQPPCRDDSSLSFDRFDRLRRILGLIPPEGLPKGGGDGFFQSVVIAPVPTSNCGGAKAQMKWNFKTPTPGLNGWIIQRVKQVADIRYCDDRELESETVEFFEAWEVVNGIVYRGHKKTTAKGTNVSNGDFFSTPGTMRYGGEGTKGLIEVSASVMFVRGFTLSIHPWSKQGQKGHNTRAGALVTRSTKGGVPKGWFDTKSFARKFHVEWRCCPCDRKETDVSKSSGWTNEGK